MTREQFLDWVERQETPYEFDGFAPVAMNGSSVNHSLIRDSVAFALATRLEGSQPRVLGPNMTVSTVANSVRYPDVLPIPEVDTEARIGEFRKCITFEAN